MAEVESRDGVQLTNLDRPLFDDAYATQRDLVDYLDAVSDRIVPVLRDRPLSVIRVHRGQDAFMQKNVPKYTGLDPDGCVWADASKRDVSIATTGGPCCGSPTTAAARQPPCWSPTACVLECAQPLRVVVLRCLGHRCSWTDTR